MRTLQCLGLVLSLLSTVACGGGQTQSQGTTEPPTGERYTIKIHRPFTQGQRVHVEVEANQIAHVLVGGEEQNVVGITEELKIRLIGDVTVDEVAEDGRAARATLAIQSFVDPDSEEAILPAGSVIHAQRTEGEIVAELEGGTLNDDQKLLLRLAFPFERPGSRLGDELFGTPEPRAVGETWDFNRGFVVEDMREDGFEAAETGVGGVVRFTDVAPCAAAQCIRLEANVQLEHASLAGAGNASDVAAGQLNSIVKLEVPTDESIPLYLEEATTTGTFVGTFEQGGQSVERQIAISRLRRGRYTPAPPAP